MARELLFEAVADQLKNKVADLKHIDMDWGQLEQPENSYSIMFEAAFISFPNIQWDSFTHNYQEGVVSVMIRVACDLIEDTHALDGVAAPNRPAAIIKMKLVNKVFKALQGFQGVFFSGLQRISSIEEQRQDGLKVWQETYITRMQDLNAQEDNTVPINPALAIQKGLEV